MSNGLSEKEKYMLENLSPAEKQQRDWLEKEFSMQSKTLLQRYGNNNTQINNGIKRALGVIDDSGFCKFCGQAIKEVK